MVTVIGERLAIARKKAGLAQVELAVAMGDRYDQKMVSHVERGRSNLRFEGAVKAARELGVSLDYLAGLTDDPTPAAQLSKAVHAAEGNSRYVSEDLATYPDGSPVTTAPSHPVETPDRFCSGDTAKRKTPIARVKNSLRDIKATIGARTFVISSPWLRLNTWANGREISDRDMELIAEEAIDVIAIELTENV